ncbi:MAG: aminotransferase class IV [Saprospiraceae bacterium]|nr:aminotransferase class IV [Saprospiraceae bacterium]
MNQVFFRGKWQPEQFVSIPITNRSFRYGDGLFESFRLVNGHWVFKKYHWERFIDGCEALKYEVPSKACTDIQKALAILDSNKNFRIRLQAWRKGKGKYTPQSNEIEWLLEAHEKKKGSWSLSKKGLKIDFARRGIPKHSLTPFKTSNALDYVLGSLERKKRNLDDLLFCNEDGDIVEGCHSNVFCLIDGKLLTPTLKSGCLNGIIRRVLLNENSDQLKIREKRLRRKHILSADEIWMTNSIQGIMWVKKLGKRKYGNELAKKWVKKLNTLSKD